MLDTQPVARQLSARTREPLPGSILEACAEILPSATSRRGFQ